MAFIIDTINGSGLYAQSAASASIATYDSNGNEITATYLTGVDLTPYQTTAGMTGYATTGDVANKLDTTAFSTVSGTFLTAVDLSNYYTKSETSGATELADAFANIPAGDAEVNSYVQTNSGYINETVSTYQTNSGNYLTAINIPESANWDSTYDTVQSNSGSWGGGGSIESYNLSAGNYINITKDDVNSAIGIEVTGASVPTGTMNISGLEYNAVNEISGYEGSAIAQYGAEKQWLVHDDTLLHLSNSAQYALGVNVSAVQELMGLNGPKLNEETFAGYWNGQPLYQQIVTMTFSSNSQSTGAIPLEAYLSAVDNGRRWIDPNNSFIHYGSVNISLPISWMLATDRRGSICLNSNALNYRGIDNANTICTAYICLKYRKK